MENIPAAPDHISPCAAKEVEAGQLGAWGWKNSTTWGRPTTTTSLETLRYVLSSSSSRSLINVTPRTVRSRTKNSQEKNHSTTTHRRFMCFQVFSFAPLFHSQEAAKVAVGPSKRHSGISRGHGGRRRRRSHDKWKLIPIDFLLVFKYIADSIICN